MDKVESLSNFCNFIQFITGLVLAIAAGLTLYHGGSDWVAAALAGVGCFNLALVVALGIVQGQA